MYQNLAVLAAFLLVYSIFAGRFESRLFNGPLMFMLAGLLLGPAAIGVLQPHVNTEGLKVLAELTLAIVLFSDAANANLRVLRQNESLPMRLLLLGLPLTVLSGWLVGYWLFPQVPVLELAILATILAPTDAALGKAVVSNPAVAAPVREGLNVESGLNDGICVPLLLLLLGLLVEVQTHEPMKLALELISEELGIGALVGVGLALLPSDQHLPDLQRLFPVEPRFTGELWLLTHPDLRHVARIKTFMEFLTERLRSDPRLAEPLA